MKLTAHQHDTLDSLLYRHYGERESKWVEMALEHNPHLANVAVLEMGTVVEIPDQTQPKQTIKATVQLWD